MYLNHRRFCHWLRNWQMAHVPISNGVVDLTASGKKPDEILNNAGKTS
jgi:hypothetical protein